MRQLCPKIELTRVPTAALRLRIDTSLLLELLHHQEHLLLLSARVIARAQRFGSLLLTTVVELATHL